MALRHAELTDQHGSNSGVEWWSSVDGVVPEELGLLDAGSSPACRLTCLMHRAAITLCMFCVR